MTNVTNTPHKSADRIPKQQPSEAASRIAQTRLGPEAVEIIERLSDMSKEELSALVVRALMQRSKQRVGYQASLKMSEPGRPFAIKFAQKQPAKTPIQKIAAGVVEGLGVLGDFWDMTPARLPRRYHEAGLKDDWVAVGSDLNAVLHRQDLRGG